MAVAAEQIDERDFHIPAHKTVFSTIFNLWNQGKAVDLVTVTQELLDAGRLESVGGPGAIADLQFFVPTATNIEQYISTIREKQTARQLLELTQEIAREAKAPKADLPSLLDCAQTKLKAIGKGKAGRLPALDDMSQLIGENLPSPPPELVQGFLHRGSKLIIGGTSKGRKTFSLMDLGISVATGTPWWGNPTAKGKVCYINFEIQRAFFAKRFGDICTAKGVTPERGMFQCWTLRGLVDGIEKMSEDIIKRLLEEDYYLIIFDPIYKALGDRDENKAGDVASMLNELEAIAVKTGAAIAFGAHYSKGNQAAKDSMDRIGGSGVFARDPDAILTMTPHTLEEHFTIDATLRNFAPQDPFVVRWNWPLFHREEAVDPTDLKQPKTAAGKGANSGQFPDKYKPDDIIEALKATVGGRKPSELLRYMKEQTGMSNPTFWRLWGEVKKSPFVQVDNNTGRYSHIETYPPTQQ